MKKKVVTVIFVVVAFAILALITTLAVMHVHNGEKINYAQGKIENAGFEEGINEYWNIDESISGSLTIVDTKDEVYEGTKALKIQAEEKYTTKATQYIEGLEPGYYYIELYTLSSGNQSVCYFYGNGTGQGECTTAIPRTTEEATDNSNWKKVTVRGISVEDDGIMELGIYTEGCSMQYVVVDNISIGYETNQETQYQSLFGGCIGWLNWEEDMGAKYYNAYGEEADCLQIMAENGCNFVRLELYNNPGAYVEGGVNKFPEGYKDADDIFDLAQRATSKQMKIELSFMYADYWGNEAIPADWLEKIDGISDFDEIVEILTDCLYNYTKDYMQRLADVGIYPEYVTLGNEMNGGILLPYGCSYTSDETAKAMAKLLNAGYKAVKEVSPDSQVALHIACNGDDMFWESKRGTGVWFFELCEQYGVQYDLIGSSYYPYWGQTTEESAVNKQISVDLIVEWCNLMIDKFDKDVLFLESGYNWGTPGQLSNNGAYEDIFPSTPEGQRDFMIELINGLKCVKDGRCVGDLYWDPILVQQEGVGWAINAITGESRGNCVETTTFFDYEHKALPVLDAYKYNQVGDDTLTLYGKVYSAKDTLLTDTEIVITCGKDDYTVKTDSYGMYYIKIKSSKNRKITAGYSGSEKIAKCTNIVLNAGDNLRIDFTMGIGTKYSAYEEKIQFNYYYEGNKELYIVFNEKIDGLSADEKYNNKPAYLMETTKDNWCIFEIAQSYGDFTIVEGLEKELVTIGEKENASQYVKLIKGYASYYYKTNIYASKEDSMAEYYIVGGDTNWQNKAGGIFSNYWGWSDEWLDCLSINEEGKYEITLEGAKAGTSYSFGIYKNKDRNLCMVKDVFTVEEDCNVRFVFDVEKKEIEIEFIK